MNKKLWQLFWFQLCCCVGFLSVQASADQSAEIEKIGQVFAESVKTENYAALAKIFDKDAFINLLAVRLAPEGRQRDNIRKELHTHVQVEQFFRNMFSGLSQQGFAIKMLGVYTLDGKSKPVVRISYTGGGVNFFELELAHYKKTYRIKDIYVAASGQNLSDTVNQAMLMLQSQSSGWIAELIEEGSSREQIGAILKKSVEFKNQGDFASSYQELAKLPENIRYQEVVHLMVLMTSSYLEEAVYKKELKIFAQHHGEKPKFAMMMIDQHFYQKQYDQALKKLAVLFKRYGKDASLLTLKASILLQKKSYAVAYEDLEQAAQLEPDFEDAYWTGVTVSVDGKDYEKTLLWLKRLENYFGYQFAEENFAGQELYKDFIKSELYQNWMASKTKTAG